MKLDFWCCDFIWPEFLVRCWHWFWGVNSYHVRSQSFVCAWKNHWSYLSFFVPLWLWFKIEKYQAMKDLLRSTSYCCNFSLKCVMSSIKKKKKVWIHSCSMWVHNRYKEKRKMWQQEIAVYFYLPCVMDSDVTFSGLLIQQYKVYWRKRNNPWSYL